jgi:hypothetical protein
VPSECGNGTLSPFYKPACDISFGRHAIKMDIPLIYININK